jgi:hypothetical protein
MTYNDEIACTNKIDLDIKGAVQAAPLLAMLHKLKEEELEVIAGDGELLIKGAKRRAGIRMEASILLPYDSVEEPEKWRALHEDFGDAVGIVSSCASNDESKFAITCIHVHPEWVEACDSFQITRYHMATGVTKATLIRKDSLKHVPSLGMTKFAETATWMHFKNGEGLVLSCRRYVEEYQDMSKILKVKGSPVVLPKGLKEAAEKAEVFSSENVDENLIKVVLRDGKCRISSTGTSGWYNEVKESTYRGDPITFTISPKLLTELTERHTECTIAPGRLKVDGGKFVYVTCLGEPKADD